MERRLAALLHVAILPMALFSVPAYGGGWAWPRPLPAPPSLLIADEKVPEEPEEDVKHFFKSSTIYGLKGLTPEQKTALLRLAAEQGDPDAQFRWAERLYGRVKAQRLLPATEGSETSLGEALFWYQNAANQGHPGAQRRFADFHSAGEGLERNPKEAARLYRLAAEQGDAQSELRMGTLLEEGTGVPKKPEEAMAWYRRAAKQVAFPDVAKEARYRLGKIYAKAQGRGSHLTDAYMWFDVAAKEGHKDADVARLKIEKQLSLAEIVKAKRQAREWLQALARKTPKAKEK